MIHCCDNVIGMREHIDDGSVDLILTSPPYDKIRDYHGFKWDMDELATEMLRVLKPGGVVVWVVADQVMDGNETGTSFEHALYLQKRGFRRRTLIYEKSNFAFPSNDFYHGIHEYIFVFSKGKMKTFNPIMDREVKYPGQKTHGKNRAKDGSMKANRDKAVAKSSGKRFSIWRYKTGKHHSASDEIAYEHPAIFPEELARDCILSFSNPGDVVIDPFCGSGTSGKMAVQEGRIFHGFDISEEYCELARRRIALVK